MNPIFKPIPVTGGYYIGGGLVPYQTGSSFTGSKGTLKNNMYNNVYY
jgi:hypothetical protein